ncbi:hypothetical protein NAEGRDRAFT_78344 [Naegleria gruberi]|uniref:Uncharacterized protein n=1 Tax=Naegleria gruberi TaxID=5762 RepID=D2V2W5_NAEGR|nr:uncharacterized protein NAEGRDRAFT_78344 [Naegleria gruberi]EFC48967.1 hypothetical protein NAEGRDRAFT_78344 [Naegleria gruberi]|eukprot:XP_002681711.1 hypothetical protein NAEGRDRAFT_78344 [Naegleria gruberi strain NEG-M]
MYIITAFGLVKTLSYTIYYSHTQLLVKLAQFFIPIRINSEIRQIAHDLYKFDFNSLIAYVMTLFSIVIILLPLASGGQELKGKLIILFGTSLLQLVHLPQIQHYLQKAISLDEFVKSKLTSIVPVGGSTEHSQPKTSQVVSNISSSSSVKEKAKLFENNKEQPQQQPIVEKKPVIVKKPIEQPSATSQPAQPKQVSKLASTSTTSSTIEKEQPTIVKPSTVVATESISKKPVEKPSNNIPTSQPEISKPIIPKETIPPKEDTKLTITPSESSTNAANVSGGVKISKLNLSQLSNIPPSTDNATSAETLSSARDSSRDSGSLSARRSGSFVNIMKNVQSPRDSMNSPRNTSALDGVTSPRGTALLSPRNSSNFSQIAERMKQKLNLKPKVESNGPVVESSSTQLGQTQKLHESPNTMDKFKKAKLAQPRKERTRANVKQLLNNVQESNENLIELPKQDDFEKLEQASKNEKKFGLTNPIFRLPPPQSSILPSASSTVEEKEEKKVNLDKVIGKSKQQQGMGGIDLQSVLNARNKLKKTGEELK